ncbi:cell envelope integrity protein TolA [Alteromonas oceanisediminis]|uniref:cell envelope integrity protein TolA n=1 Tax=Alteromonas oceanisediminis TaxID=2836180 RepID=UPI001BDAFB29|nr:cell envelope integrity protein TolA [Alteromonas oceanisediminis]MBT0587563.1 cell envelope integrity protein TolA [Alteromonas oceanisediminis]
MTENKKSFAKSGLLHLGIAAILMLSVVIGEVELPDMAQPQAVIQAQFIDAQAIHDQQKAREAAQAAAQAEERERQQQVERRREAEREAKRKAAADKARKEKQAKEQAEQRELERKAKEAAERKKAQEARERAERERKAKEEAQRKEQEALDKLMQEQLAAEQAAQAKRRSQQVLSEVEKYRALITQTINRYIYDDISFKGKTCRLNIRLASNGLVTQVTILSGDDALCRASRSAVLRPDRMPVPDDLDVYNQLKDLTLTVKL